jgi:hypothetical protein
MSEAFHGSALLGPGEADGAVPFVIAAPEQDGEVVVVAGLLVGGAGMREVEGNRVPVAAARAVLENSRGQHGLEEVPLHVALYFGDRALREGGTAGPAPWTAMWEQVPEGVRSTARLTSPLRRLDKELVPAFLHRCKALVDPEGLVVFGLERDQLAEVVPRVVDTLRSDAGRPEREQAIAAAVGSLSRSALDAAARQRWGFALDVLSVIFEEGDAQRAARHTALAMRAELPGDEVPFVRIWVERALASTVELALQLGGPRSLRERLAARGVETGEA